MEDPLKSIRAALRMMDEKNATALAGIQKAADQLNWLSASSAAARAFLPMDYLGEVERARKAVEEMIKPPRTLFDQIKPPEYMSTADEMLRAFRASVGLLGTPLALNVRPLTKLLGTPLTFRVTPVDLLGIPFPSEIRRAVDITAMAAGVEALAAVGAVRVTGGGEITVRGESEQAVVDDLAAILHRLLQWIQTMGFDPLVRQVASVQLNDVLHIMVAFSIFLASQQSSAVDQAELVDAIGEVVQELQRGHEWERAVHGPSGTYYFVVRPVKLYSGPRTRAQVQGNLGPNQLTRLVERKGAWIRVEYFDYLEGVHRSGWCMKKYLRAVDSPPQ